MRKTSERQWSNPVKDKQPREETLNTKGDLGQLKDILRRVVKKPESPQQPASEHTAKKIAQH